MLGYWWKLCRPCVVKVKIVQTYCLPLRNRLLNLGEANRRLLTVFFHDYAVVIDGTTVLWDLAPTPTTGLLLVTHP